VSDLSLILPLAAGLVACEGEGARLELLAADRRDRRGRGWGGNEIGELHQEAIAVADFVQAMRALS
jgi:hypothetical protein